MPTTKPKRVRETFWAGFCEDEIHFYRESSYYEGVSHADLFKSKAAAKRCYDDVRPVRVPPSHLLHGKDYDSPDVSVHGGLTFAAIEPCTHEDGMGWWFGFDCAHAGDASYDPDNLPEHEVRFRAKYPELGRSGFGEHYWQQSEVERETERLAEQLAGGAHEA